MLHLFVRLQAAWFLKMRALTEQTYVDEVEMDDEGIAELFMEDSVLADVASQCVQFLGHTHLSNWVYCIEYPYFFFYLWEMGHY